MWDRRFSRCSTEPVRVLRASNPTSYFTRYLRLSAINYISLTFHICLSSSCYYYWSANIFSCKLKSMKKKSHRTEYIQVSRFFWIYVKTFVIYQINNTVHNLFHKPSVVCHSFDAVLCIRLVSRSQFSVWSLSADKL